MSLPEVLASLVFVSLAGLLAEPLLRLTFRVGPARAAKQSRLGTAR